MIQYYINANIFDSTAQTLVNPVNTVGVMGKGLAWQFKKYFGPAYFATYQAECTSGKLTTSHPTRYRVNDARWILNFATKQDWRNPSELAWIQEGLAYFCANYERAGITSIAFPKLGCANGGLSWEQVGPLMAKYLGDLPIPVEVYIQKGDHQY